MATLTNTKIKDTYDGLLKTTDNDVIGTTEKVITDGLGNASILSIGTQSASFSEDIEINGHTIGKGSGDINSNVVLGTGTLTSNTTGNNNVAIGVNSSLSNTTGVRNISIGTEVLVNNTTGNGNIALGFNSLYHLTGSDNIAIGRSAGQYSTGTVNKTAGDQNVYIGANTVSGAQDTDNEIIIGYGALGNGSNTATYGNSSITDHYFDGNVRADFFYGDGSNLTNLPTGAIPTLDEVVTSAAPANISSINLEINGADLGTITNTSNTLFGENALASHTSGSSNTAIGQNALTSYTSGSYNTAFGAGTLDVITSGTTNTAVGYNALGNGTTLSYNTAIGNDALFYINGSYNVALGHNAGKSRFGGNKTLGDSNIYIGSNTVSSAADTDNEIVIGANATGNGSNSATYGDSNITKHIFTGGNVGIGADPSSYKLRVREDQAADTIIRAENQSSSASAYSTLHLSAYGNTWGIRNGSSAANGNSLSFVIDAGGTDAEKMQIDSSGRVGIGASSPQSYYSGADNLVIYQGSGEAGITIATATNTTGALYFADGTSGSEQYRGGIGYNHTNDELFLVSGGSTKATIDSSGNVGIGTSSPQSVTNYKFLTLDDSLGSGLIARVNGTNGMYFYSNVNGSIFSEQRSLPLIFETAGSERMRIDSSGNVGIGTSPASKLHLYTSANSDMALRVQNSPTNLYVGVDNTTGSRFVGSSGSAAYIGTTTSSPIEFATANTVRATIDSSGRIGIGTSSFSTFDMAKIAGSSSVANDLTLYGPNTSQVRINFSDPESNGVGEVGYNHSTNTI